MEELLVELLVELRDALVLRIRALPLLKRWEALESNDLQCLLDMLDPSHPMCCTRIDTAWAAHESAMEILKAL